MQAARDRVLDEGIILKVWLPTSLQPIFKKDFALTKWPHFRSAFVLVGVHVFFLGRLRKEKWGYFEVAETTYTKNATTSLNFYVKTYIY